MPPPIFPVECWEYPDTTLHAVQHMPVISISQGLDFLRQGARGVAGCRADGGYFGRGSPRQNTLEMASAMHRPGDLNPIEIRSWTNSVP